MLLQVVTQLSAPRKRWPSTISSWGRNMVFRFGHFIGSSESLQQPAVRRKLGGRWLMSLFTLDQSPGLGIDQRRTDRQVDMQPLNDFSLASFNQRENDIHQEVDPFSFQGCNIDERYNGEPTFIAIIIFIYIITITVTIIANYYFGFIRRVETRKFCRSGHLCDSGAGSCYWHCL